MYLLDGKKAYGEKKWRYFLNKSTVRLGLQKRRLFDKCRQGADKITSLSPPHLLPSLSLSLLSSMFSLNMLCSVVGCLEKELIKVQASSARVTQYPMNNIEEP